MKLEKKKLKDWIIYGATPVQEEFFPRGDKSNLLATWWRQATAGTYYWRCKLPAKHLPGQVLGFRGMDLAEKDGRIFFPRQRGNTAIWQFPGNATAGIIMAGMQEEGIRVLMEMDDTYLHAPDVAAGSSGWLEDFDKTAEDNPSYAANRRLSEWVDGIIVSTEPLAELYGELNDNIYICPNSIDVDDWEFESQKKDDGVLRIGWGASLSHLIDVPLVKRAFQWAANQPNVEVWVFGIGHGYKFPGAVKRVPWTNDQAEYKANLSRCDVHVCPLYETTFSRYKSDLKALESSMAGGWPIVSSATAYKPWHDRTMVCTTPKDWENAIKWVVRHRDEIPALAAKAKEYVLSERTIDKNIDNWRRAVDG